MKLSEIVKQYREENKLSLRNFADKCQVSHVQIVNLEKGFNEKGNPFNPSLKTLTKLSKGMNIPLSQLILTADDVPDKLKQDFADRQELWGMLEQLSPENRQAILQLIKAMTQDSE